jgi:hypothetical protein
MGEMMCKNPGIRHAAAQPGGRMPCASAGSVSYTARGDWV